MVQPIRSMTFNIDGKFNSAHIRDLAEALSQSDIDAVNRFDK